MHPIRHKSKFHREFFGAAGRVVNIGEATPITDPVGLPVTSPLAPPTTPIDSPSPTMPEVTDIAPTLAQAPMSVYPEVIPRYIPTAPVIVAEDGAIINTGSYSGGGFGGGGGAMPDEEIAGDSRLADPNLAADNNKKIVGLILLALALYVGYRLYKKSKKPAAN